MVFQNCDNFMYINTINASTSGDLAVVGNEGIIWYETDTKQLKVFIAEGVIKTIPIV